MKYRDLEKANDEKLKKIIDTALVIYKEIKKVNIKSFGMFTLCNEKVLISIILSSYVHDFDKYYSEDSLDIEDILTKYNDSEINEIKKITFNSIGSENKLNEKEKELLFEDFNVLLHEMDLTENNISFSAIFCEILSDIRYISFIEKISSEKVLDIIEKYGVEERKERLKRRNDILKQIFPFIDFNSEDNEEKQENLENPSPVEFIKTPFGIIDKVGNSKENSTIENNEYNKEENINPFSSIFGGELFDSPKSFLDKNGTNLNKKYYRYNPAIGREDIVRKCAITLETPNKSVLLIGPNGVGKTAIVEGLAKAINDGKYLDNYEIIEINASSLISGKGIVGSFQKEIEELLSEIDKKGNVILFIDEIHQIYEMGISESNVMNMFKKPISQGKLKLIGATTKNEYDNTLKYDSAFVDRFDVYEVSELKEGIVKDIIIQRINFLEEYYDIYIPFDDRDLSKFADYLLKITNKENRKLNQIIHNPRLVIQLLDTIFATAKVNKHMSVEKEDIIEAITCNTKIKSQRYSMPKLFHDTDEEEKTKVLNNVIDFSSYKNRK